MNRACALVLLSGLLLAGAARADTSQQFVRMACVPDAGLLQLDTILLHDSVAHAPKANDARNAALAQAGFHDPHNLALTCTLGSVTYAVSAEQAPTSNYHCGGAPETYLTLKRNGQPFVEHVVFGDSCNRLPGINSLMVADGPASWRGRETQVCYVTGYVDGTFDAKTVCTWTMGDEAAFAKHFPVNRQGIDAIAARVLKVEQAH